MQVTSWWKKKDSQKIWVDTIKKGRFEDTNQMFIKPEKYNFHVSTQDAKTWVPKILEDIKK